MSTKKLICLFSFIGIIIYNASAIALPTENLLQCRKTGNFYWDCQLQRTVIATPIEFDAVTYETEYRVTYDFGCEGHQANLGLKTERAYYQLEQGVSSWLIDGVLGAKPLETYDPDPTTTQYLTFSGPCALRILSIDTVPSRGTQVLWGDEARLQARIIELSATLVLLARDYEEMRNWSQSKLELMHDRLERLVAAYPANIHYKVMFQTVKSAIDASPPPYGRSEVGAAATAVLEFFNGELAVEVERGYRLIERYEAWQLAAEHVLLDVLASLP